MEFKAYGHKNVLSTHKTTLEFTKDDYLTKKGDCILAINADFKKPRYKKPVKIVITISSGKFKDNVVAYYNPEFKSNNEMVIRKSSFVDERTFAIKANKAAKDIDRQIVSRLKSLESVNVWVEKAKIKCILFDFDNTLEEWTDAQRRIEQNIAKAVAERYNINKTKFEKAFRDAKYYFIEKHSFAKDYDRHNWIKKALNDFSIRPEKKDIDFFVDLYWNYADSFVRLFPDVKKTLAMLRKMKLKLGILTDSDGKISIKTRRIKKLGIYDYFDAVVTGDKLNLVKPDKRLFLLALKKLKAKPEECIMLGDHPEFDLLPAKELGFTTVLMKKGHWAKKRSYEDFLISNIKEIIGIIKKIS